MRRGRASAGALLSCLVHLTLVMVARARSLLDAGELRLLRGTATPAIVVFHPGMATHKHVEALCAGRIHPGLRLRPSTAEHDCRDASRFAGVCRHAFSALVGFHGVLTWHQLTWLAACAPHAVASAEPDAPVRLPPRRRALAMTSPETMTSSAGLDLEFDVAEAEGPAANSPVPAQLDYGLNYAGGGRLEIDGAAAWHLDRVDQRGLPLDGRYYDEPAAVSSPPAAAWPFTAAAAGPTDSATPAGQSPAAHGAGVHIYIVDSGIRASHAEFASPGGGSRVRLEASFVGGTAEDEDGHGTHVAASAAGGTVGVARGAEVHAVRVLDASGGGTVASLVAGLDWVAAHAARPAVAVLSLGVPRGDWTAGLESVVRSAVAANVTLVVAAGNSRGDACTVAPAFLADVMAVGASDLPVPARSPWGAGVAGVSGARDGLYSWTNTGACVDVFAPGVDIYSACGGPNRCQNPGDDAYVALSGTSMASPLVAGAAALHLALHPTDMPAQVQAAIVERAQRGELDTTGAPWLSGTPNLLLFSRPAPAGGVGGTGSDRGASL